jgi:hypothetical protein
MNIKLFLSIPLVAALTACGGGSDDSSSDSVGAAPSADVAAETPSAQATGIAANSLSYIDPVGKGWRLVKDASSTRTRIVLNLVGPSDLTSRGVGFNLRKGKGAAFSTFPSGAYAVTTGVFALQGLNADFEPYAGTPADPVLFVSAPLKSGDVLSTGIFQKDRTQSPKDLTQPLLQVAVELATSNGPNGQTAVVNSRRGDIIPLAVVKARLIPADIGGLPDFVLTPTVIAKAKMVDIVVQVGTLIAN